MYLQTYSTVKVWQDVYRGCYWTSPRGSRVSGVPHSVLSRDFRVKGNYACRCETPRLFLWKSEHISFENPEAIHRRYVYGYLQRLSSVHWIYTIHRLNLERLNLERPNLERLNLEWTEPRMDWTSNGLNLEWTQPRMNPTPNGLNPEWTQPRMGLNPKWDWTPTVLNPEWTQPRLGLNLEWTQPRMDSTSNGLNTVNHLPLVTSRVTAAILSRYSQTKMKSRYSKIPGFELRQYLQVSCWFQLIFLSHDKADSFQIVLTTG